MSLSFSNAQIVTLAAPYDSLDSDELGTRLIQMFQLK